MKRIARLLHGQQGMSLVVTILLVVVLSVVSAGVVFVVVSEINEVKYQQRHSAAYYKARSNALEVIKAVRQEIIVLDDAHADLGKIKDRMEANRSSSYDPTADLALYQSALTSYQNAYNRFVQHVLPGGSYINSTFKHYIDTNNTGDYVTVKYLNGKGYLFSSTATLNNKTATSSMYWKVDTRTWDLIVYDNRDPDPEDPQSPYKGKSANFEDALYSGKDIRFDQHMQIYGSGVSYVGNLTNANLILDPGYLSKKIETADIVEPAEFLQRLSANGVQINSDPLYNGTARTAFVGLGSPAILTPSHNGYYTNNAFNALMAVNGRQIAVDSTLGDVILKLDNLSLDCNNVTITVTGSHKFIIYVDDISKTQPTWDVLTYGTHPVSFRNSLNIVSGVGVPNTFLLVNNRNFTVNNTTIYDRRPFIGALVTNAVTVDMNSFNFDGYIYAPWCRIMLKNNILINGAMVGGDFAANNNINVHFVGPFIHFPLVPYTTPTPNPSITPTGTSSRKKFVQSSTSEFYYPTNDPASMVWLQ